MTRTARVAALGFALTAGLAATIAAPASRAEADPTQTFRAQSDLVVLRAAVYDRHSAAVSDLTRDHFRVFEDNVPQEIRFFLGEDRPVAVGLVVDNSTSMTNKRQEVIAASEAFARSSHPDDALFTVNFNERVWFGLPTDVPFTSDLAVLHVALSRIQARGETAMYDAIASGLDHLTASQLEERALVVVSDGGDSRSHLDFEAVLQRANRSNAVIYTVGVFDALAEGNNPRALRRLAEATGGLALFPTKLSEVSGALERVARDIRHRYTIGYVPSNSRRDGTFRNVRVVALDRTTRKPLEVRVRAGYVASSDKH